MDTIDTLLKPTWGCEQWIDEGWLQLNDDERKLIITRLDALFKDGLPFEIKHDKLLYIYTFSLLAQLGVLGIHLPLTFESQLSDPVLKEQLHAQLLDEIFHGLVFAKILYLLCAPHAVPPEYNERLEEFCRFIRNEACPKTSLILLNVVSKGWMQAFFESLCKQGVAPDVFKIIIADKLRHDYDAELYRDIGMPSLAMVQSKLATLEKLFLTNIIFQYKYSTSLSLVLEALGTLDFLTSLNKKYYQQLTNLNLTPSRDWMMFVNISSSLFPGILKHSISAQEVAMSPGRKALMTQWKNPSDPTMVGEFNLNVSCLDFFNKAYSSDTLTTLMLQTISLGLTVDPVFRTYLQHGELLVTNEAYTSLVVKLPDCNGHVGAIIFENCHTISLHELSGKIRNTMKMMIYCYKKREALEKAHPHLLDIMDKTVSEMTNGVYSYPLLGNSVVSLSNIGFCGFSRAKSPLRESEAAKFTLLEVERKMVWNKTTQQFEAQDILPVSMSADHRIFDGNVPVPKIVADCFIRTFEQMVKQNTAANKAKELMQNTATKLKNYATEKGLIYIIDQLIDSNLELGYKLLNMYQTVWLDYMNFDSYMTSDSTKTEVDPVG